jgi:ubiquinone/menaquinone biosynthesis C-methylase UbiE
MNARSLILCVACVLVGFAPACERRPAPPARRSGYDQYRRPQQLVAALHLAPGQRVAEVGAGSGYLTPYLAQAVGPGGQVVATDIDATALSLLRQRTAGLPQVQARLVQPDAPGLEAGRYDLILLAQVDHLLADRAAYLRSLRVALAPGGRIALCNAERHRDAARAALTDTEFTVEEPAAGLPDQFLWLLRPR